MMLRSLLRSARCLLLLAAASAGVATAAPAATIGVDDVVLDIGFGKYSVKHMDVTDSSLGAEELKLLFAGKGAGPLVDQFAKFSAKSIVIPEMDFESSLGGVAQTLVYRDGTLSDIVTGIIGQMDFAAATQSAKLPDGKPMSAEIHGLHASKIDLVASARMFTEAAKSPDQPLQLLYGATSVDSYKLTFPGLDITMGPASAHDLKGRPLARPMLQLFNNFPKPAHPGEKPSPEETRKLLDFVSSFLDIYGAFAIGGMDANNIKITFAGDPASGAPPFEIGLKRYAMTDFADSKLGDATIEGIDFKSAKATAHLGKYQVSKFDFKALLANAATLMKFLPQLEGRDKSEPPPPEFLRAVLNMYASYSLGKLELVDAALTVAEDPATGKPVDLAMARLAITDVGNARIGAIALDGIDVHAPQGRVHLGSWSLRGLDYQDLLASVGGLMAGLQPGPDGKVAPPAGLPLKMPKLDEMRIEDVDADFLTPPGPDAADSAPTPVKFSLGLLSVRPELGPSGIPSALAVVTDHLKITLPPNDPKLDAVHAAGIDAVDLSSRIDAGWDETAQQLKIGGVSLSGEGLGKVFISGTLDNVPREAFAGDEFVRQAAWLGAVLKAAEVKVENTTLLQKIIAVQAKQAGQSEAEMKSTLILGAATGIPAMLGNSPAAKALANALAKFLADPKSLHIAAQAKDGVGAGDIIAPDRILDKVDLTATANE